MRVFSLCPSLFAIFPAIEYNCRQFEKNIPFGNDMNFIEQLDLTMRKRPWLVSFILAALAIYPQLVSISMEWKMYAEYGKPFQYFAITPIRFLLFFGAAWLCLKVNFDRIRTKNLWNFAKWDALICALAVPVFFAIIKLLNLHVFQFSMIYFEVVILWIFVVGLSYMDIMLESQRKAQKQMEELQLESVKSRYAALINQINPHFFFNSLNGLSSLVRKKDEATTLQYIEDISDIFRYTLQNEPLDLVPLESEVNFARQYISVFKTRYANKLTYDIDVPEDTSDCSLPVLTMLPILENISTHNIIDSEHRMDISIHLSEDGFLEVSNLKYPKPNAPNTAGTGLDNLSSRFRIICGKDIQILDDGHTFTVRLPVITDEQ